MTEVVRVSLGVYEYRIEGTSTLVEADTFSVPMDTNLEVDSTGQILVISTRDGFEGEPHLAFINLKEFPVVKCRVVEGDE